MPVDGARWLRSKFEETITSVERLWEAADRAAETLAAQILDGDSANCKAQQEGQGSGQQQTGAEQVLRPHSPEVASVGPHCNLNEPLL